MLKVRAVEILLRVALAGFFGWSAWQKLQDLSSFTESVGNFQFEWMIEWDGEARNFFAAPMDAVIAYLVPWFELVAAAALLLPFSRSAGAAVLVVMLMAFNLGLAYAWNLGITDLNCGCHGVSEAPTNFPLKMASNFGLMALLVGGFYLRLSHRRLVRAHRGPSIPQV